MTEGHPWLHWAKIDWSEGQVPCSAHYGDVYFSRSDGLAESRHVFVHGNDLPDRFARWHTSSPFVIAETGFGTGLNFLAALESFLTHAPPQARLHFFSVEKHPVHPDDMARAAQARGVADTLIETLLSLYPAPLQGLHRRRSQDGRVTLSIYYGDIQSALESVRFNAHAWFLDGFSPARNPQMWSDKVLALIHHHSGPGTTLATFTAVGRIRRTLQALGFEVRKAPGFGHKRDMTRAVIPGHRSSGSTGKVIIIGGGIAGATLAHHLAGYGCQTTVIEAGESVAAGASGNPQGALYFKPGVDHSPHTRLHTQAYGYALHFYRQQVPQHFHGCGLLALAHSAHEASRQSRFIARNDYGDWIEALTPDQVANVAGIPSHASALHFPDAGWLRPAAIVRDLLDHPGIRLHSGLKITHVAPDHVTGVNSQGKQRTLYADQIIIAAGPASLHWLPPSQRPALRPIRGQIIQSALPDWPVQKVVCGEGYAMPADNGMVTLGASFTANCDNDQVRDEDTRLILQQAQALIPGWQPSSQTRWAARASVRAAAPDYMPLAGRLPSGVCVLTGLGSKGFLLAPLLSAHLADMLVQGLPALTVELSGRVRPDRFAQQESENERLLCTAKPAHSDPPAGASGHAHS